MGNVNENLTVDNKASGHVGDTKMNKKNNKNRKMNRMDKPWSSALNQFPEITSLSTSYTRNCSNPVGPQNSKLRTLDILGEGKQR